MQIAIRFIISKEYFLVRSGKHLSCYQWIYHVLMKRVDGQNHKILKTSSRHFDLYIACLSAWKVNLTSHRHLFLFHFSRFILSIKMNMKIITGSIKVTRLEELGNYRCFEQISYQCTSGWWKQLRGKRFLINSICSFCPSHDAESFINYNLSCFKF